MPKFPKGFARRKSTANALEDIQNAPVTQTQPSFRVFDRPTDANKSFDGGVKLAKLSHGRPSTSPINNDDNLFADFKGNRYVLVPWRGGSLGVSRRLLDC